jgi:murein DD-endopeptidase MepM/ murein hydrolase activator NlpD
MAVKIKSQTKALFEKAFPERQIYHRSGGSVRYVSISPWRQAVMAGAATLVVGWCLFATVSVLLQGPGRGGPVGSGGGDRRVVRVERELQQAKAAEAIALSLLEQRTNDFQKNLKEAEQRHETLKSLFASLQGQEGGAATALNGDNQQVLVDSSIEEADARQSRPGEAVVASNDVVGYRAQFDKLRAEQTTFLDAAEDEAVGRSERARGVLRLTGVQVSRVLDDPENGSTPLIKISASDFGSGPEADAFKERAEEVAARLQEARKFETMIHTVPLGAPIDSPYRETSGFGFRADPFTRKSAWHEGADLAAFLGAPIKATAPGVVTFAGNKAGYGRCVEVDHGLGFKTRYGHMNTIAVKEGAKVAIGSKLGTMGSSGRSTGPHLHYEVWFHGKSYDPIKFLRAGKHVYQG